MTQLIHIHRPRSMDCRRVMQCPFCKRARRIVVTYFDWYDPIARCCGCGSRWGGCRTYRPTGRNVPIQVAEAKRQWLYATTRARLRDWFDSLNQTR